MREKLTKSDVRKIEEEIEHRKLVIRKECLEAVKEARAHGDLSENFEYHAAKREKNQNESRIRYLENMLKNAIIISEGDQQGIAFFEQLYSSLGLHIEHYTFEGHDKTIAYSLSIPFASSLVFGSAMKHQPAPGTTFKRHLAIAKGLMSEDDFLLSEILFNPNTTSQLDRISAALDDLRKIIARRDAVAMKAFLDKVRDNIK